MDTMELVKAQEQEMIQMRRHIHQNPELSNQEFQTTKLIQEKLTEYGIEIADIGLKTGVVGVLKGRFPGKTLAIREDIDALPMKELTGLPFASASDGVCHSCGHDIHTTVLLYTAKILSALKDELHGNVMFLFQPAEENGSGAKQLIDCGFDQVLKPDAFVGLHVAPKLNAGCIGLKDGPASASSDMFQIRVTGKGGHGAHPENCVDPIIISAYILTQLQTIVSRENHPIHPAVLTVGSIHGGQANNVIPDYVEMGGTLRSLEPESRQAMQAAIDRITVSCAEAMRGKAEVSWNKGMPPLVNDTPIVNGIRAAAQKLLPAGAIKTIADPSLGSEDFSYLFPTYGPGAQFSLGCGNDSDPNTRHGLHNSKNVFDEGCLAVGTAVLVQYARDFLG
ncbi:MAG TPA: amidohydrolase [Candidatus Copromonas avistercoris]|nr:amidohydrolase [Candidatus Copromonas avistercoris]